MLFAFLTPIEICSSQSMKLSVSIRIKMERFLNKKLSERESLAVKGNQRGFAVKISAYLMTRFSPQPV